jgi:TolB-like protein
VLPFTNVSGDESNQYLVEGFKQELIKTLRPIQGVKIKTGRDNYSGKSPSQIASILGVDSVMFGSVNRIGDELKVTYELISGSDNTTLAVGTVTGQVEDIFSLQAEVAQSVRSELFGNTEQVLISASRPANFHAYRSFLQGNYAFDRRGSDGNFADAMRLFEETIELDPDFGPAYLQLATAHALAPVYGGASLEDSNRMAIIIAEQGIAADPTIEAAAGAVYGLIYHRKKEWAKSELAYQQATTAAVVDSNAFNWYSRMLASVGRLDKSSELAVAAFDLDPESAVIASRVALSYSWLGDAENASPFFELAGQLGAEGTTHLMGWSLFLAREGQIDKSREIAKIGANQAGFPPGWIDDVFDGMIDDEKSIAALSAVNQTADAGQIPPQIEVVARTLLGDIDGAMQVAKLLEEPGEAFEMDLLWIPEFAPLRKHPDFIRLMDDLGVAEYWNLHGCKFSDANLTCPES